MKCAIMQPCYLPWLGHLRLISMVDEFVFLDDAQYSKNSWGNRNRVILADGRMVWLTVPVARTRADIALNEIGIDVDPRWRRKHTQTLTQAYGRHPHFSDLAPLLEVIGCGTQKVLADLNCDLLEVAARCCHFPARLSRASALGIGGRRSGRLESMCRHFGCDSYLSTPGSRGYLEEDGFGSSANLRLEYMNIDFAEYSQANSPVHVARLSFIDALANLGWGGVARLIELPG